MISYDNIIAMQVTGYMNFSSAVTRFCKLHENNFHQATPVVMVLYSHIISLKFFPKAFEKGKIFDSYYFAVEEMDAAAEGIRYSFPGE